MGFYQLFRWWSYRRIKHTGMPYFVWVAPCVVTSIVIFAYLLSPSKPNILGHNGVLAAFTLALSVLPGFLIAGLATVAAISNQYIDQSLPEPAPTIPALVRGKKIRVELTTRLFLLSLFSYISMLSILLLLVSIIGGNLFDPSEVAKYTNDFANGSVRMMIKIICLTIYSYFLSSLFVSLMHGIYFIAERAHKPD